MSNVQADPDHLQKSTSRPSLDDLLEAIRARRGNFIANKKIDADIVQLMKQVGVYRALVAKQFGGEEWSPSRFFHMIEEISRADGSAGWVASFGVAAVYLAILPLPTLNTLYADGPDVIYAGGNFPSQLAVRTPDGIRVNGRWSWGSGCSNADVIGVGIAIEDEARGTIPLLAVMPKSRITIEENWNVNGMRGTGSFDLVVKDVIVPESWTFVRGAKASLDMPLYQYPAMALSSQALSVVTLGIGRAAIDELVKIAAGRTSITGAAALANRPTVQSELAKAEASLRSARALFYELTDEAYARLCAGGVIDNRMFSLLRLAATHAAHTGADVARTIYTICGTTGIYSGDPIAQALQDSMIIPQHAFLSEATWQNWGAALLGLDAPGAL